MIDTTAALVAAQTITTKLKLKVKPGSFSDCTLHLRAPARVGHLSLSGTSVSVVARRRARGAKLPTKATNRPASSAWYTTYIPSVLQNKDRASDPSIEPEPLFAQVIEPPQIRKQETRRSNIIDFEQRAVIAANYNQYRFEKPDIRFRRMKSYVQFITTPTADTPGTTLLLHFDNKRYYIGNVAEGTQRASVQRATKLVKLSEIFLTGKTEWANMGGLLGMILTLADQTGSSETSKIQQKAAKKGSSKVHDVGHDQGHGTVANRPGNEEDATKRILTIHGGKNLTHTLATARRFVFRKGMPVVVHEYEPKDEISNVIPVSWSDRNINVWAMPISPERVRDSESQVFSEPNAEVVADPRLGSSFNDQKVRDKQMREAVVSDMFNSAWRLDALVEVPLAEVRLPAAIFVRNSETGHIEKYHGPLPGSGVSLPDITVLMRQPWPGALIQSLPPTSPSTEALSYIIRNHPQRGRFDPVKAKQLKVEKGRKYAKLTMGESVEALDGTIVTPEMVLGEGKDGGGFAVVELPSAEYVMGLIGRPEWKSKEVMKGVGAIIWILGDGVSQDHNLRRFINAMGHLKHIVSSRDHTPNYLALDSAASAAIRLHQIYPTCFPIPDHDNLTLPQKQLGTSHATEKLPASCVTAQRGQMVQLEPAVELLDHALVPHLNTAKIMQETPLDVLRLAQDAKGELKNVKLEQELTRRQENIAGKNVEIITLGTGSASPSKYRNVSATLIRVPGSGSYLLDCGENTLGQLKRVFPPPQLREVLRDLKMIWISHLHADHHLGTVSVVKAWYQEVYKGNTPSASSSSASNNAVDLLRGDRRLFVVSAAGMIKWLADYSSVEDFGYRRLFPLIIGSAEPSRGRGSTLSWENVTVGFNTGDQALYVYSCLSYGHYTKHQVDRDSAMVAATGLADIQAVNVDHCVGAKAVSLTFPTGFKLSYSGDCRPSKAFAQIGRGSTVLLHEGTFEDEMQGDAVAKKHSTTSEALGVGIAMGARRIVLTHFSQRYQKIPVINEANGKEPSVEDQGDPNLPGADADVAAVATPAILPDSGPLFEDEVMDDEVNSFRRVPTSGPPETQDYVPPMSTTNPSKEDVKIAVAFDLMRVKVGEIAHLERFTPALLKLFEASTSDDKYANDELQGTEKTSDAKRMEQEPQEKRKGSPKGNKSKTNRRPSDKSILSNS